MRIPIVATCVLFLLPGQPGAAHHHGGAVVEQALPGQAAEQAGLQVGDVLVSWESSESLPHHPGGRLGQGLEASGW